MNTQYCLHKIKFTYTDMLVLDIGQQTFESGKITALLGANGAGKSTLLGLLAFILQPSSGAIEFAGKQVRDNKFSVLRREVGLVQQNPYLINASAKKNIELGLKFRRVPHTLRVNKVAHMLSLLKIESLAERPAKLLSGGEAQKIAIARTLVLSPKVLLLDEPFTYLDSKFISEFKELLKQLRDTDNKTIIFTTHDRIQAKEFSDQVVELVDGQLTQVLN